MRPQIKSIIQRQKIEEERRVYEDVVKMMRRHIQEIKYTSTQNRRWRQTRYGTMITTKRRKRRWKEADEDMNQN